MNNKPPQKNKKSDLDKTYYFVSGLPRSGSTLLCNILAQNPRFHTTSTSGVMDVIFGVRNSWDHHIEFRANPNAAAKLRVMRGILDSFYADIERPVVFDKCRGWLSLIEMAEEIVGHKVKILVPVRDMRDVLASFEKIWRDNAKDSQSKDEVENYMDFQTIQGRTEVRLRPDQPVGLAYNRLIDAVQRGYADRLLLVDFDDLTHEPKRTMDKIYDFLGEERFEHDFDNVEQVTWENDEVHGLKGLHDIRSKVAPIPPRWPEILGDFAVQYEKLNFWKNR